jgi:hypothetical protein
MITALIFVISALTLLQFFVSYCRSLIAESRSHTLSEEVRELCGGAVASGEFSRLERLIALCPGPDRSHKVQAVAAYFKLLRLARALLSRLLPSASQWIEAEQGGCAYVAAVVLDWRIAHTRAMMAQQASH